MRVLVTGSHGFMGKHLISKLKKIGIDYFSYDIENNEQELTDFISKSDFIVHLAGVMRPLKNEEFYDSNLNLTKKIIDLVKSTNKSIPFLLASSTQAILDNDYGKTKKMCEDYLLSSNLPAYVFRFTNAFGKWGRPNYNSVASTFMYNISHDLEIFIRDPNYNIHFIYVGDIIDTILKCITGEIAPSSSILSVSPVYDCTIGHLAELIKYFKNSIESNDRLPFIKNDFEFKLFISFCDYFSDANSVFNIHEDERGYSEEIFKSKQLGKISAILLKPGFYNHGCYHTLTYEVFQTIKGECSISLRQIDSSSVKTYYNRGDNQRRLFVEPHTSYEMQNAGSCNCVILRWVSDNCSDKKDETI